ncbi:MAG: mannose-1-phosphate guanyltransferase [Candidatus Zixiibacteriota bacterium]
MASETSTAVIMAGGFGTRLKPLTVSVPKPMVPMVNRPLMEYVVDLLRRHGHKSMIGLLYFQPEAITDHFGDGKDFGVEMQYIRPDADFGTAGSVRNALPQLADRFIVISGDVLTDINLTDALAFHDRSKAEATMVLTRRENPLAFGIVVTEPDGRITRFLEKPSWGEVFSDTINTGIYILERSLMETLPVETALDFGKDVFPQFLAEGRRLYGYTSPGYWRDVGNVTEYAAAHHDLLRGMIDPHWTLASESRGDGTLIADPSCAIAEDVTIEGTVVLGGRVSIGAGATVANSVLGPGTVIGAGAEVRNSILWSAVTVGGGARIDEAIIQTGSRIGRKSVLRERTIVSEMCQLGAGVTVHANCRIWPRKRVEDGATVSSSIVWGEQYSRELFTDAKVSGLTNREFTPEFAARLGAAFAAQFTTNESIFIGRDSSAEARAVAEALKSGVSSSGVNIRDLRETIVPILRSELKRSDARAGIYVRSTPDEPMSTDAIFFDSDGFDLPAGRTQSIERVFASEDFRRADPADMGVIEYPEGVLERYRHSVLREIDHDAIRGTGFRVVIDYNNGFVGEVLPSLLAELGIETISLNSNLLHAGVLFPIREHGPLSRIVNAVGYDLGISINPAGERFDMVDRHGVPISSQQLLVIMASLFWKLHPGKTIAVPVTATGRIDRLAAEHHGSVVRVKNDHLSLMRAAAAGTNDFVGGTRGGFILPPRQRGADAIINVIRLFEWLARTDSDFSDLASACQTGAIVHASVSCPWNLKGLLMRRIMEHTSRECRQLIDGVRLELDDGWIWMAPHRRTAHFELMAESDQPWRSGALVDEWRERIAGWAREAEATMQTVDVGEDN